MLEVSLLNFSLSEINLGADYDSSKPMGANMRYRGRLFAFFTCTPSGRREGGITINSIMVSQWATVQGNILNILDQFYGLFKQFSTLVGDTSNSLMQGKIVQAKSKQVDITFELATLFKILLNMELAAKSFQECLAANNGKPGKVVVALTGGNFFDTRGDMNVEPIAVWVTNANEVQHTQASIYAQTLHRGASVSALWVVQPSFNWKFSHTQFAMFFAPFLSAQSPFNFEELTSKGSF